MTGDRPDAPIGLRDVLSQRPERQPLCLGLSDDTIVGQTSLHGRPEQVCQRLLCILPLAEAKFDQKYKERLEAARYDQSNRKYAGGPIRMQMPRRDVS